MANHIIPTQSKPIVPQEGWHVQHLFFSLNHTNWASMEEDQQESARKHLEGTIARIRKHPDTQLLAFSMVGPKSDLGFMILTPDLQDADRFAKDLQRALGPDVLVPAYSYLSMTELSEYTTKEEEFKKELVEKEGLVEGSEPFTARLAEWNARMAKYNQDRLYPNMPDWQVMCFYNMSKRRNVEQNWYASSFEARRQLMSGHAKTGRAWHGKIRQLITGSTGLDEAEWGVTLFAHDTHHIKGIVYEMRFDEVSAVYAEFGDFYIGIQLPLKELLDRLLA
ncbi:MAG: heme-dependent peroxidase [Verrucomicrobiaceae bacterium]|nr:heme-dependent peroxidase [Verrucomicrobiaceae bacterium]